MHHFLDKIKEDRMLYGLKGRIRDSLLILAYSLFYCENSQCQGLYKKRKLGRVCGIEWSYINELKRKFKQPRIEVISFFITLYCGTNHSQGLNKIQNEVRKKANIELKL